MIDQSIEGEYVTTRERLLAVRDKLLSQQATVLSIEVKGKKGKELIGGALGQIQVGLNQVNAALEQLAQNRIDALEQLATQVAEASLDIETQTQDAYDQIEAENQKARDAILRQELIPIIYHWYRKILGRDPSSAEYDAWIATADYGTGVFDLENLKNTLLTGPELAARQAGVDGSPERQRVGITRGPRALARGAPLHLVHNIWIKSVQNKRKIGLESIRVMSYPIQGKVIP